jgi:hypothetical protein
VMVVGNRWFSRSGRGYLVSGTAMQPPSVSGLS